MPVFSDATLAFGKLIITFICILVMLRLHVALWKTIVAGGIVIALLTGLPLAQWPALPLQTLASSGLIIMEVMLFGILLLSGIQEATGQSRRLVDGLERYLHWPRIRLIVFPALVGLLPMPGGALFSCPMLDAAAHGLNISPQRKTLINYWFRHIWELAWPLYPGYILVSSLLGLPLLALLKYTAPLVLFSFLTGWFFYMRDIDVTTPKAAQPAEAAEKRAGLGHLLYESLPLIITIGGAAVFGFIFEISGLQLPSQASFMASLTLAIIVAAWQGRGKFKKSFRQIALSKSSLNLLLLVYTIYLFKDVIGASGIVGDMSHISGNRLLICSLFVLLPLVCGMLTGIMVGYVGACFPILIGILAETGMQAETLPLIVLAVISGNVGQLITPLHVCIVVSCQYYKVRFMELWRSLLPALAVQMCYGALWAFFLYAVGAHF